MKKKILSICLVLAILAVAATGTLAYLTDEDGAKNVFTFGSVSIIQNEKEIDENGNEIDFVQDKEIYPAVGTPAWDPDTYTATDRSGVMFDEDVFKNVQDKIITVTNNGESKAYVRTLIAFEAGNYTWETLPIGVNVNDDNTLGSECDFEWIDTDKYLVVNGKNYFLAVATYEAPVESGTTTKASLKQIYFASTVDNEDYTALGGSYEILAVSQAVQVEGFADADTALNTAFGVPAANAATAAWFAAYDA